MSTPLRVVPPTKAPRETATPISLGQQIRQLQAEARRLAREQVGSLSASLAQVQQLAEDIAGGGEAYPAGIRDIARRLAEDSAARTQALEAILARG
ncbi:MAG: hypothetical protein WA840_17370 [Caulobacteraceae bacterium]